MSILHPLTPRLTTKHSLMIILSIWFLSLVVCSPDMALIQYEANITSGAQCFISKSTLALHQPAIKRLALVFVVDTAFQFSH